MTIIWLSERDYVGSDYDPAVAEASGVDAGYAAFLVLELAKERGMISIEDLNQLGIEVLRARYDAEKERRQYEKD